MAARATVRDSRVVGTRDMAFGVVVMARCTSRAGGRARRAMATAGVM
jgi:hypothetical protein